jgi:hypothetical protein
VLALVTAPSVLRRHDQLPGGTELRTEPRLKRDAQKSERLEDMCLAERTRIDCIEPAVSHQRSDGVPGVLIVTRNEDIERLAIVPRNIGIYRGPPITIVTALTSERL